MSEFDDFVYCFKKLIPTLKKEEIEIYESNNKVEEIVHFKIGSIRKDLFDYFAIIEYTPNVLFEYKILTSKGLNCHANDSYIRKYSEEIV